jgi:hypothetical protein
MRYVAFLWEYYGGHEDVNGGAQVTPHLPNCIPESSRRSVANTAQDNSTIPVSSGLGAKVGLSPAQSSQHQVPLDSRHNLEDGDPTPLDDLHDKMLLHVADRPLGSLVEQADNLFAHGKLYDTIFPRIRSAIFVDPDTSTDEQRRCLSLTESHGLLWYHGRIYVPNKYNLRQDIIIWHVPSMAHLGIDRTLQGPIQLATHACGYRAIYEFLHELPV